MVEKTVQLTGSSARSIEEAVEIAVSRAAATIDNIRRVHLVDVEAVVERGAVARWRVKVDLTFGVQDIIHE
ncbi:dodecin family protein [Candidatus Binatia bacterium]|nr:dodecin family protein [Candidatus Binatia bacterium]